jgi:hypothetical protein
VFDGSFARSGRCEGSTTGCKTPRERNRPFFGGGQRIDRCAM